MAMASKKRQKSKSGHDPLQEEHSPLWLLLLQKFALGNLSAAEVETLANAACLSGCSASDLQGLAGLGGHGNSLQNRDFAKLLFANLASPQPSKVTTQLSCRNADGLLGQEVPLLLPRHWVQALDEILVSFKYFANALNFLLLDLHFELGLDSSWTHLHLPFNFYTL